MAWQASLTVMKCGEVLDTSIALCTCSHPLLAALAAAANLDGFDKSSHGRNARAIAMESPHVEVRGSGYFHCASCFSPSCAPVRPCSWPHMRRQMDRLTVALGHRGRLCIPCRMRPSTGAGSAVALPCPAVSPSPRSFSTILPSSHASCLRFGARGSGVPRKRPVVELWGCLPVHLFLAP